jgi:hypothetical protein
MFTPPTDLGGGVQGISTKQTTNSTRDSSNVMDRRTVRASWNTKHAYGTMMGDNETEYKRRITPFRAVTDAGDFLARVDYTCGGPAPSSTTRPGVGRMINRAQSNCDDTGIPGASCNPKFVYDSSDYTRFRRQQAVNHTYNQLR